MKAWIIYKIGGLFIVTLVLLTFATIGIYELSQPEPLHASASRRSDAAAQNGCVVIGTVGTVIVARCEDDDTGAIIYANSAGYMDFEP